MVKYLWARWVLYRANICPKHYIVKTGYQYLRCADCVREGWDKRTAKIKKAKEILGTAVTEYEV